MKSKLEYLMRSENLTAITLARKLGIQPSAISHILNERNKPSFVLVVKILKAFPYINPDWLLLDSDKIYRDDVEREVNAADDATPSFEVDVDDEKNIEFSAQKLNVENDERAIFSFSDNSAKKMQRVIILYTDGSFESFIAK